MHELKYVLNQAGIRTLVAAPSFKTSDYAAMIDEVRPECPALQDVLLIGREDWTSMVAIGRGGSAAQLAELQAELSADDPINIQYTSGHDGLPEGRDPVAPQHSQQRLLRRRDVHATRKTTGSAFRCRSTTASAW